MKDASEERNSGRLFAVRAGFRVGCLGRCSGSPHGPRAYPANVQESVAVLSVRTGLSRKSATTKLLEASLSHFCGYLSRTFAGYIAKSLKRTVYRAHLQDTTHKCSSTILLVSQSPVRRPLPPLSQACVAHLFARKSRPAAEFPAGRLFYAIIAYLLCLTAAAAL